jgi:hypothetical protein
VVGEYQFKVIRSRPTTLDKYRGAPGTPGIFGVTAIVVDAAPWPTEFNALTRNAYIVPFVRPVTVADGDADSPSSNVVQAEELLVEYSTT